MSAVSLLKDKVIHVGRKNPLRKDVPGAGCSRPGSWPRATGAAPFRRSARRPEHRVRPKQLSIGTSCARGRRCDKRDGQKRPRSRANRERLGKRADRPRAPPTDRRNLRLGHIVRSLEGHATHSSAAGKLPPAPRAEVREEGHGGAGGEREEDDGRRRFQHRGKWGSPPRGRRWHLFLQNFRTPCR